RKAQKERTLIHTTHEGKFSASLKPWQRDWCSRGRAAYPVRDCGSCRALSGFLWTCCELDDLSATRRRNPLCVRAKIFRNIKLDYFCHDSSSLFAPQSHSSIIFT